MLLPGCGPFVPGALSPWCARYSFARPRPYAFVSAGWSLSSSGGRERSICLISRFGLRAGQGAATEEDHVAGDLARMFADEGEDGFASVTGCRRVGAEVAPRHEPSGSVSAPPIRVEDGPLPCKVDPLPALRSGARSIDTGSLSGLLLAREPVHVVSQRLGHASPVVAMTVTVTCCPAISGRSQTRSPA